MHLVRTESLHYSTVIFKLIDEYISQGEVMIKISGFLCLLLVLVLPSGAQDFLDGGYVSSGDNGDMGQYFADPIFRSPSSSYVSPDPAVRGMQESLDRPMASIGSTVPRTKAGIYTGKTVAKTSLIGAAGRWNMQLSDGRSIYLELYQSGARFFGRGSITLGIDNSRGFGKRICQWQQNDHGSGSCERHRTIFDIHRHKQTEPGVKIYHLQIGSSTRIWNSPGDQTSLDRKTKPF